MKLKKILCTIALTALTCGGAQAATVDSFFVDTRNPDGADSAASLTLGTEYIVTVSGTFVIDSGRTADAEYFDLQTGSPRDTSGGFDIGLQINDMDIDWGAFTPTSIYSYVTSSLEGIINVRLAEASLGAYSDNTGSLFVEVATINGVDPTDPPSAVPLPASALLLLACLGGLLGFRRKVD
ncbi:MAG: VPLPA-CTERM sorting domain-containing protein [Pseudomonadota bacterium]